jgi:hypothetical protein
MDSGIMACLMLLKIGFPTHPAQVWVPVSGNKTFALLSDAQKTELHCCKFHHACLSGL